MIIILFRHNIFFKCSHRGGFDNLISLDCWIIFLFHLFLSLPRQLSGVCVALHLKICWKIQWSHLIFNTCLHLKVKSNKKKNTSNNDDDETPLRSYFMSILIELTRIYTKNTDCVYKAKTSIPAVASLLSSWYFNNFVIWFTLNKLAVGVDSIAKCQLLSLFAFVHFVFLAH